MQEEFSHTVLHRNKAVGSQPVKTRGGAAKTPGAAGLTIQNFKLLGRQLFSLTHLLENMLWFFSPFWFRFCQYLLPILFLDCVHDVEVKTPYSPDHLLQYFCLYFFFCCVAQDSSLWLGPCCYGADRIQGLQMLVWCVYWWLYVLIYFQNNLKNIKHSCRDASVCCVHISNIIPCGVFPVTVYDAGVFFSKTFCITFYSTSTMSCIR